MPDSVSPNLQKSDVPVIIRILGSCGCLTISGLFLMILLPSFLRELSLARKSEGKADLGNLNRAQQAYQLENKTFASSIDDLDVGIISNYFDSQIVPQAGEDSAIAIAIPRDGNDLKSYTGFTFLLGSTPAGPELISGICETDTPSKIPPAAPPAPSSVTEAVQCPPGSSLVE